jgi:peroxiredoxin
MRQLADWESKKPELENLGCTIYAISVDNFEQAQTVAATGVTFPIAYGCTKERAETIGAWWGNHPQHGDHIQPTEFLLRKGGLVLGSMYASGPVGRMSPSEVSSLIYNREKRPTSA